jgi:hypothetical protein
MWLSKVMSDRGGGDSRGSVGGQASGCKCDQLTGGYLGTETRPTRCVSHAPLYSPPNK